MKTLHTFALAGVIACAIPTASAQEASRMADQTEIPNQRQPRQDLITAGQPDADAWASLAADGVTTVINLRTPAELADRNERAEVEAAGLAYREVPVDGAAGMTLENARILQSLLGESSGTVLVHCGSGNRVGALLAIGAVDAGMPVQQALELGRAAGMTSAEAHVRGLLEATQTP